MSLAPACSFVLGNLKYDTHASEISVTLGTLPCVNRFQVRLPAKARFDAAPGDPATLELDGGEGSARVITGEIAAVRRSVLRTDVVGADGGARLSALRSAATYEKQTTKNIIRSLAEDAGVEVGSLAVDLTLATYVAHQHRTGAEHIAYLAALEGAAAQMDGEGRLEVAAPPEGPADTALLYGREIIDVVSREQAPPAARHYAIGNGPAGSASAVDALRLSAKPLPEGADKPGAAAVWEPYPVLRTPSDAQKAGEALDAERAARSQRLTCRCFLLPKLRPGMVVEIQELPNGLSSGPWRLTRVRHQLHPESGGGTVFEACSAAGGLTGGLTGGLLGSLASAVGGLL